jgi:hypothetical protein
MGHAQLCLMRDKPTICVTYCYADADVKFSSSHERLVDDFLSLQKGEHIQSFAEAFRHCALAPHTVGHRCGRSLASNQKMAPAIIADKRI